MLKMLDRPDGAEVVLEGLSMRLHKLKNDNLTLGPDLKRVGLLSCATLLRHKVNYYGDSIDSHLSEVLQSCIDKAEFPEETCDVVDAYLDRLKASYGNVSGLGNALVVLVEKEPFRFLDGIFFDSAFGDLHHRNVFGEWSHRKNPLSNVDGPTLLNWCRQGDFQERLIMLSGAVHPFDEAPEGDGLILSEQAHAIIDATQDPSTVLRNFCSSARPESLANIIAKRGQAFRILLEHSQSDICDAAEAVIAQINQWEKQERHRERLQDEQREQRFE